MSLFSDANGPRQSPALNQRGGDDGLNDCPSVMEILLEVTMPSRRVRRGGAAGPRIPNRIRLRQLPAEEQVLGGDLQVATLPRNVSERPAIRKGGRVMRNANRFRLALTGWRWRVGVIDRRRGRKISRHRRSRCLVVHRDGSGFVDERNKDLEQTVKDVRGRSSKKNGWLQVVEAQEQADIVLEITERTLVERAPTVATTTTTYSKDGKAATSTTSSTPEHDVVLKAVMHVGDYSNELTGRCDLGYLLGGPFRQAAKNLVGSLEDWVKSNYTRLQLKNRE
jgi:hypothetical protein